ncbi:SWIM zinc finger domain-containing protein [Phenylobacterium sp.]|uniref:SWIM zinc finger family protein n=1 Tax=Phenylobacterium sp. TaxID=1871053 RepID=UPI002735A729|nr:SWIM zinc finger family protein [Phenylobacterium sp.]MDP3853869.1 SWIM zinc finger family protein [Phenylobacterium sp.]
MDPPPFDIAALRKAAGDKMFARGQGYFEQDAVDVVAADEGRLLARVFGTETYRVELLRRARGFAGSCTCPAFDDWGVCKHMIALALWGNAAAPEDMEIARVRWDRLRAPLLALDREALVDKVLDMLLADPEALDALEMGDAYDEDEG